MKKLIFFSFIACLQCFFCSLLTAQDSSKFFTIRVIDQETGRGVPLVEFKTTSNLSYYTDSHGIIAFGETGLLNQEVGFELFSYGYQCPEDGLELNIKPGKSVTIAIRRVNIAERLYRITGQDIYGHSVRLGLPSPIKNQALNGKVTGQDTFIETLYNGKIYWFWGDTFSPTGFNGEASGATSELPGKGGLDPSTGVDLNYFTDEAGLNKHICPFGEGALVWIGWLAVLKDENGKEQLYATYRRINKDGKPGEGGIAAFNDSTETFNRIKVIDEWYGKDHRSAHPVVVNSEDGKYLYIINHDGIERVRANISNLSDPSKYERYTCIAATSKNDIALPKINRDNSGRLIYRWSSNSPGLNYDIQKKLLDSGRIAKSEGLWQLRDVTTGNAVSVNPASVFWNEYRNRWVMIAYEFVGGVWYFEGDTPTGPWTYGRKIVSHNNYDFYNVGQHPLFDQDGGRLIYFEGTYTTGFSSNTNKTPLYDYNQMMYRLSLDDKRLSLPAPVYFVKNKQKNETYLMREDMKNIQQWEQIVSIPFYAIPPSYQHENYVPVYAHPSKYGEILSISPGKGPERPVFYAMSADSAFSAAKTMVALYAFRFGKGRIFYSSEALPAGIKATRSEKPVCLVWQNPSSILSLDYKAEHARQNK